ncbi:MAG: tetratricopeptide repeat protein, partial [Bacteroidetes bacterium]|nr:tetratricopeptide repeat protein [Bacteroidota bacterium]
LYPESPFLSEARFNIGSALMTEKKQKGAIEQFQTVIQKHPADVFADRSRLQIARILFSRKEYKASLDTLDRVVEQRSDDIAAEALLIIGENYLSLKKPADALQAFKDLIEQYTEYPVLVERARLGAGESYERLNDRAKAKAMYEEIVKNPVDPAIKKNAEERLRKLRR